MCSTEEGGGRMDSFQLAIVPDQEDAEAAGVYVEASVGSGSYLFLLDTGSANTRIPLDDYTATFKRVGQSNAPGVFGIAAEDLVIAPSIQLGPISKTNLTVARPRQESPQMRSLIGMDVLKDYICHFRFDRSLVHVQQSRETTRGYH